MHRTPVLLGWIALSVWLAAAGPVPAQTADRPVAGTHTRGGTDKLVRAHRRLGVEAPALVELERQLAATGRHLWFVERAARQSADADALGLLEAHMERLHTLLDEVRREVQSQPRLARAVAQAEPRFEQLFLRVEALQAEPSPTTRARLAGEIAADPALGIRADFVPLRSPTVVHGFAELSKGDDSSRNTTSRGEP